nr:hypothetical protein [Tanacetum cinerariifolium]
MQQPMQNPEDISDPTTAIDMTLALMAKSKQYHFNKQQPKESSNPSNMQIAQPVQNVGNQVVQNAVQNQGIQIVENINGLSVVLDIPNRYGNINVVKVPAKGNGNGINDASEETERVKANCILENNLQQAATSEEQYTELLEPIPEPHQVPQNDSNVKSEVSSVEQGGRTIKQHPANIEETRVLYDSLYNNLAIEVEKVCWELKASTT